MTPEEMQEKILELQEKLTETETERDTLLENNKALTEDVERVRALNQKYFEKLSMQDTPENNEPKEEPVPTCEEFAKTLPI